MNISILINGIKTLFGKTHEGRVIVIKTSGLSYGQRVPRSKRLILKLLELANLIPAGTVVK